jgi:eukaryotic-like serine/threonine-protein kinase
MAGRLAPGAWLGAYEILAPIAAGGMGEVYRARDPRLGREVAIKVVAEGLVTNPDALARFEREARAIAALSHPNIVALHDVGRDNGTAFAVMELLDGESLDRRLAAADLPWRTAVDIAAAVADGLASAHARGIVHRDLKPGNIFIRRDGLVKIVDFGLATAAAFQPTAAAVAIETMPGVIFGTVGYMSPEQVRGEPADERSDIFSLGCVLYEMLSRERPFRGDAAPEVFAAILRDQPRDLAAYGLGIPVRVEALVRRCLDKNPDHRFQSARDLAFALRDVLSDSGHPARAGASRAVRRGPRAAALIILGVLFVGTTIFWLAGGAPLVFRRSPSIRALAVLPLESASGDPQQDDFAETMTEQLTTRLASLGSWRVTSPAAAVRYRGTRKTIAQIAAELGVDAIVEGSVARQGSTVKVAAQLVEARTGRRIWGDAYEQGIDNVLVLQNHLVRAIARETDLRLAPDVSTRLASTPHTVASAAYDAYVRGRHAWDKRSEAALHDAIRFFQDSIDADPTYAPAYAGLADAYAQLGYGSYASPEDTFPRARAAAEKALVLDSSLAEGHASRGYALMYYDWDFAAAESEYRRAIQLNPSYAVAHQWYAYLLTAMERPFAAADAEISIAGSLDPLSPAINTDRAYISHYYGRNDDALHSVGLALEMDSKFPPGYFWLGRIYTSQGRYSDADQAFHNLGPLRTWTPAMAALGYMYGKAGRQQDARAILAEFDALTRHGRYASGYAIAAIHAGLGDRERVFQYLDAAHREHSHWLVWLKRDPRWDEFRADPRFENLVRKIGLLPPTGATADGLGHDNARTSSRE